MLEKNALSLTGVTGFKFNLTNVFNNKNNDYSQLECSQNTHNDTLMKPI